MLCVLIIIPLFALVLLFVKIFLVKFLFIIFLIILISLLTKSNWHKSLLLSGVAYALSALAEAFVTLLLSFSFSISNQQAIEGPFFIIGLLLSKALFFFVILLIRHFIKSKSLVTSWKKTFAIFIIPASTIFVMILQYNYFIKMQAYDTSDTILTLFCFTFLLASNFVVFELINQIYRDHEKDKELALTNQLIVSQEERYHQLFLHTRDIQKIRHDYKNFLIGVLSDLKLNNYEALERGLEKECHRLNMISQAENNLNIVDHILKTKTSQALEHHIKINYISSNLNTIRISSIDLSVLIGNAIDNAIDAVTKLRDDSEKEISVFVKCRQNHIVIIVKNKVLEDVDTKHLFTTKNDSFNHGFGIPKIKNIVAKYHGTVCFTCENKMFEVHMVLSNSCDE